MIIVRGNVVAADEHLEELTEICLEHVRRSREEPGCIEHGVHADVENPARLSFFEKWADEESLRRHFAVPESRTFVKRARELSVEVSRIDVFRSEPIRF